MTRHSPCIGICKLDDVTGYCLGCGRTGSEIGDWISMSESQRGAVWQKLPARLSTLSVRVRLMPWIRDELLDWVRDGIEVRRGTWVVGAPGALAEFPCTSERTISVNIEPNSIVARAPDGLFRLRVNDKIRAFSFTDGGPIVLGLPKGRARIHSSAVIEPLGPDTDAIDEAQKSEQLFDFGIGRQSSRFCVRTGDAALASTLSAQARRHWSEAIPAIGQQLVSVSPSRIVESAAARIEVFTKIPLPGDQSSVGAHTHFLPEFLKTGEEITASLALPDYAAPVAIFYPSETGN